MLFNIPNLLTLLRIALIPVFIGIFYLSVGWASQASAVIFGLAAATDWFDGYLARRLDQVSPLGAFLDPVADKLMVAAALIVLVEADPTPWLSIPAVVIIGREITVSALREWMAELGERTQVAVSVIGKVKTSFQMAAIIMLLFRDDLFAIPIYRIGIALLYLAVALTLWSMLLYLQAAWPSLNGKSKTRSPEQREI